MQYSFIAVSLMGMCLYRHATLKGIHSIGLVSDLVSVSADTTGLHRYSIPVSFVPYLIYIFTELLIALDEHFVIAAVVLRAIYTVSQKMSLLCLTITLIYMNRFW